MEGEKMKTKTWIMIVAGALAVCLGLSIWVLWPEAPAARAEIWVDGALYKTVELDTDQEFTVLSAGGSNTVTVKDGKIAVTAADCPDHYCMQRGFCDSGTQIVCLPNRVVIKFVGEQEIDGAVG